MSNGRAVDPALMSEASTRTVTSGRARHSVLTRSRGSLRSGRSRGYNRSSLTRSACGQMEGKILS